MTSDGRNDRNDRNDTGTDADNMARNAGSTQKDKQGNSDVVRKKREDEN